MTASSLAAQAAVPTPASAAGFLAARNAHAPSSGGSVFDAVLQQLTTQEDSAPAKDDKRNSGANPAKSNATKDDSFSENGGQAADKATQTSFDAAAAIAAIVAPQGAAADTSRAMSTNVVGPTSAVVSPVSATAILAARLGVQSSTAPSAGASQTATAADPTSAGETLMLPAVASVAPAVVAVHVQSARTYLGVDGVVENAKAKLDASSVGSATAPLVSLSATAATAPSTGISTSPVAAAVSAAGLLTPSSATAASVGLGVSSMTAAIAPRSAGAGARPSKSAAVTAAANPSSTGGATSPISTSASPVSSSADPQAGGDHSWRRDRSGGSNAGPAGQGNPHSVAAPTAATNNAVNALGLVSAASGAITTSSIDLDQLPDVIANQAQALIGQNTAASATAGNLNAIKELDVQLNPADLGSLTVKMRLANGNLAVVIHASNPSTAKLIEGERDAIADRLTAVDQPVASVVVQTSDNVPTQTENSNASSSGTFQQGDAQSGAANGSNGQARSSRDQNAQATPSEASHAEDEASQRAHSGDLFV